MTGSLLPVSVFRAVDSSGNPMSGALLQFYLTGTTTPTPVYTTSALSTPLSNPVVADSGGLFAPMYLSPSVTYRMQLKTSTGSIVQDIDPVAAPFTPSAGSISASMLASGAAVSNIGYTPMNEAGDTATGELIIGYTLSSPPNAKSVGFRGTPLVTKNAVATFAADDAGKMWRHTDATAYAWTIPPNSSVAFPDGTIFAVRNIGSGIITLTRGAGVTLTLAGAATSKDVAFAANGYGALIREASDVWLFSGTGGS